MSIKEFLPEILLLLNTLRQLSFRIFDLSDAIKMKLVDFPGIFTEIIFEKLETILISWLLW